MRRKKSSRKVFAMNICIRGINESVIKSLDQAAGKRDISREEYLRQCLERIAYDDRALEKSLCATVAEINELYSTTAKSIKYID